MAEPFSPQAAFTYLTGQGYSPVQAAAIAGNIQQESSGNPTALNPGEGAFGLIQWRLDRRKALEDFARARGTTAADPYAQLDFIGHEMRGSEARNSAPFLAATDLPTANAALRKYIRYGDNSEGARLNYGAGFLGGEQPAAPSTGLLAEPAAQAVVAGGAPAGILAGMTPGRGGMNMAQMGMGLLSGAPAPMAAPPMPPPMQRRPVDISGLLKLAGLRAPQVV